MTLRTVGVRLVAEIGSYQSNMKAAAQTTRDFKGELDKASSKGKLDKVSDQAAVVGAGLLGLAGAAVKMSADFDKSMSAVAAATHAPASQIAMLRAAAIQAGKDTQYSATEAADGITELSKAGVSTAAILGGGLKGALSLAAAGQISVGEAAETAASAMTQFKLSGDQVPHVADLLAAGAGKAQGSVHDMSMALNQSGLVAAQFGLSIEDTTGVLAEFASAGLKGSDAGTSLRTMLLAIANPSKQTRDLMNELGISFYDAQGKFIGFSGVAEVLRQRLGKLTDAQRQQALGQIFGNDAIRSASILYTDGAAGAEKWKNAVNDSGYAASTAAKLTDNLAGDVERLRGSLETLVIQAGGGANGGLRILVKTLGALIDEFGKLPPAIGGTVTVVAGVLGATALLGAGWVKARKASAEFRAELEAIGPTGERAAAGLSRVTSAAGKAGLVFAAFEATSAIISHFQKDLNPQLDALTVGLQRYADSGQTAGEASRVLGNNLDDLKVGFKFLADDSARSKAVKNLQQGLESLIPPLAGTNTSLAKTQERVTAIDQALAGLVSAGNVGQAKTDFDALAKQLAVGGVSMDEFRKQFPQYAAALESAGSTTTKTTDKLGDLNSALAIGAGQQDKYKTAADAAAGAARGEREAIGALFSELKAETDPVFALIDAQKKLSDAQKAYTSAVKAHGKNSKEAQAADIASAQAALGLQNAVGNLSSTFNGKLDPAFVATLKAAGLTKAQIKQVEGAFGDAKKSADRYTGNYAANVSAPGAKGAKTDIDHAYDAAHHFAGPYVADLRVTGAGKVEAEFRKLSAGQQALKSGNTISRLGGWAEGGWTGPGSRMQPAGVVHADEFVISKPARQSLEQQKPGAMDYMNRTGQWPGYAGGGRVWPFPVTVADTKIPNPIWTAPGGGAGPGYKWMEAIVRQAFPGMPVYSDYRPGAITITGNRSYHGFGRAVDFAPSRPLAEWINLHYMAQTKELITPWQSLNIQNGHRHQYSALVENEHNFAGGNAHDHWAMANGGVISEPIFGVGASGRTYSFGENYMPERVTPMWQAGNHAGGGDVHIHATFTGPVGSQLELENWFVGVHDRLRHRSRI